MAIKMPHKANASSADAKAEAFISGASLKAEKPTPPSSPAKVKEEPAAASKTVVNMRFDAVLLERIDASAKKRGISRTAWLHWAAAEMLGEKN